MHRSHLTVVCCLLLGCGAQAISQDNVPTERNLGIALYKKGDFKGASTRLQTAVKKNKEDAEAWYYLGLSLTGTGDTKQAIRAYEAALRLQPNLTSAHIGLAFALLVRNKLDAAKKEAERALQLDNKSAEAHYIVGVVQLRMGDNTKALDEANAAIALNPAFAQAYFLKTQTLLTFFEDRMIYPELDNRREVRLSRYKEAAESLRQFQKLTPDGAKRVDVAQELEALQFSIDTLEGRNNVLASNQVTTRARVLAKPEPTYTERARSNDVTGTVILRAVFAADGLVKHILVIRGLPDGLTERAIAAASKIKFVPAMKDGKPVSMWMQLEYNFNLF